MEKSSKRGKIPQQDWPAIIKRYELGETLASIARTYDCSPPAISYIVSRSRARNAAGEGVKELFEPSVVRGNADETSPSSASQAMDARAGVGEELVDTQGSRAIGSSPEDVQPRDTSLTVVERQHALNQPENTLMDRSGTTAEQPDSGYHDTRPEREDGSVVLRAADTTQNGGHRRTLHLGSPSQSSPLSDRPTQDLSSPLRHGVRRTCYRKYADVERTRTRATYEANRSPIAARTGPSKRTRRQNSRSSQGQGRSLYRPGSTRAGGERYLRFPRGV